MLGIDPSCKSVAAAVQAVKEAIEMIEEVPPFMYCGRGYRQDRSGRIYIDMRSTVSALEYIQIPKQRKASPQAKLNAEEITELRSSLGSLGWIARQLRADICVDVSLKAQRIGLCGHTAGSSCWRQGSNAGEVCSATACFSILRCLCRRR